MNMHTKLLSFVLRYSSKNIRKQRMEMNINICLLLSAILNICNCIVIRNDTFLESKPREADPSELENINHIRRKRYLGISKRFKLNKRYQECVAPGDAKGHCKHLSYCHTDIFQRINTLNYLCVIDKTFVGVCCPDDIVSAAVVGSQLVMDLPAGGYDYDENDGQIGCGVQTGAKRASTQIWPWMAALYRKKQYDEGAEQQFCGGALITDSHVLTASHCIQGLRAEEIRVRLGEYDFGRTQETRSRDLVVAEIIGHEDFVHSTYENDIAILRLETPTSFNSYIWPICLPMRGRDYVNKTAVVAGWGQQYFAGPLSEVLLQVSVPVWPQQKCADAFIQRITDDNICAAGYEGGKDSCLGDSGGPLMYQLDNGRWITIGIVSWGIRCGDKDNPGIYTKVGNFLPWIIEHTMAKKG